MRASHGIYLDSASGAPLDPNVVRALRSFLEPGISGSDPTGSTAAGYGGKTTALWANPNSLHQPAQAARKQIRETADAILRSLGLSSERYAVLFTSSGTEAIQTAVRSALLEKGSEWAQGSAEAPTWWVSRIEHSCNQELIPEMQGRGVHVVPFSVDQEGRTDWGSTEKNMEKNARSADGVLSLLTVQNETGITSHILSASTFAKKHHLKLCLDHVAGWEKVDFQGEASFARLEPEFIAVSGHKIGAFAGTGALVYRKDQKIQSLIHGSQQGRLRGGTENSLGILSLGLALEGHATNPGARERVRTIRDRFESEVAQRFPFARFNRPQDPAQRSAYVSNITFAGFARNLDLALKLDLQGISVSSGSACQSGVAGPSFVLLAYGIPEMDARNSVRVSLHEGNRWEDLDALLRALEGIFQKARA